MKFLLFNLVVAGALVYLFGTGPIKNAVTGDVAAVAEYIDTKMSPVGDNSAKDSTAVSSRAIKPVIDEAVTPDQPVASKLPVAPVATVAKTAPGVSGPIEDSLPPITDVTEVKVVPVHPVSPTVEVNDEPKDEAPKFMTPEQRWRELNRLAHDMQMMFSDKVTQ